ncbi:MAG: tetratricopeptide repeat protein [Spirochaetales bacterium]|nr:tetratricopeptide repeat protein [Spirochaetales bacterium]
MANKKLREEEKKTAEEKLIGSVSNFFQKNKLIVIIVIALIIVGIIVSVIVVNSTTKSKYNAQITVANLESRYAEILSSSEPDWTALIADLNANIKGGAYPSVKSAYLLGLVYYQMEDYANAQSTFEKAFNLNKDIYLASEALLNAAACADMQGNTTKALDLYNQVYNDYPESGSAPKALFNAARLYLQTENTQLAMTTFAQVADYYPESEYGKLAKNLVSIL